MHPVSPSPEDRPLPDPADNRIPDRPPVAAEVDRGEGMVLARLARRYRLPAEEGALSASCLWRWADVGKVTPDGRVVKLETVRRRGRVLSTEAALRRFLAALAAGTGHAPPPPGDPSVN